MMTANKDAQADTRFLDMQAHIGITKHTGGLEATNELLGLCHVEDAREVLNVGCGIGVASAYIARKYGCHVVGVDISEKMIEWSRRRAREERVEAKVEFRTADVLDLPFETDRFDVVFAESVLAFVEDKERAIAECVRVTKPGGYVGLNEGLWIKQPSPEMAAQVKDAIGPLVPTVEAWQALWETSGLRERVVEIRQVDASTETKSRVRWIGWRWLLRAWARGLRLYLTNPAIRQSIKGVFAVPSEVFQYAGYGLFVGRK
ncbi:MAG TPA: class I SAM-dependent methyltransferase [Anaerolineae bacterium]|nr:class I SAM-dependent methyltransferase [Anaerolineae bacterium]